MASNIPVSIIDSTGSTAGQVIQSGGSGIPPVWAQNNPSFTQTGTGAIARTVNTKLNESISVLDFGADPTGATDSTAAFSAAAHAAVSAVDIQGAEATIARAPACIIDVPVGTYLITQTVDTGGKEVTWRVAQGATITGYSMLNGRLLREGQRVNAYHNGTDDYATGFSIRSNIDLEAGGAVLGVTSPSQLQTYTDRDSVGLYVDNTAPAVLATITTANYNPTTIAPINGNLTATQVKQLRIGMIIDTMHVPKFSGFITGWATDGSSITVSGWYQVGGSGASTPTTTAGAYVNPFTKVWANNSNVFLTTTGHATEATGFELGSFNNKADPMGAGNDPKIWGYDSVNLGTYNCESAFIARSGSAIWYKGFESQNANVGFYSLNSGIGFQNIGNGYPFTSVMNDGSNNLLISNTGSMELGSVNVNGPVYQDFHTSGSNNDYDVRIIANGGSSSASGQGTLTLNAAQVSVVGSLSASSFTGNIPFTQTGTGAIARTVNAKLNESISVLDFGADPTGTTDSTLSIQAALNSGGTVYFTKGTFLHSGLTINSAVKLVGAGENQTYLQCTGTNVNAITIGNGVNNPNDVSITDLTLTYTTAQTSSAAITVSNGHNIKLERIRIANNTFNGINLNGGAQQFVYFLRNLEINNTLGSAIQVGVDGTVVQDLWISDSIIAGSTAYGINLLSASGFYFKDIDILNCMNGIRTYPATGKLVVAGIMNNILCDTCTDWGWNIIDNGGTVAELALVQCWASTCGTSTGAGGLYTNSGVANPKGLQITGGSFTHNYGSGIKLFSGSKIDLSNVQVFANSEIGSGIAHGIEIGPGLNDWSVMGGSSGAGGLFSPNLQGYGIMVNSGGSTNYRIIGCDVTGNVTGGISDGGTSTGRYIYGNPGFITSYSGEAELLSGTSSITFPHYLSATPNIWEVYLSPQSNIALAGLTNIWVSGVTATQITVTANAVATANLFFGFSARTKGA